MTRKLKRNARAGWGRGKVGSGAENSAVVNGGNGWDGGGENVRERAPASRPSCTACWWTAAAPRRPGLPVHLPQGELAVAPVVAPADTQLPHTLSSGAPSEWPSRRRRRCPLGVPTPSGAHGLREILPGATSRTARGDLYGTSSAFTSFDPSPRLTPRQPPHVGGLVLPSRGVSGPAWLFAPPRPHHPNSACVAILRAHSHIVHIPTAVVHRRAMHVAGAYRAGD